MIGYFILKKYFDGKTLTIHVIDLFSEDTSQSNFLINYSKLYFLI